MPGKGPQYLADDFIAAHASNYSEGRGGYDIDRVAIHYIQGTADSAINWFRNPSANVSAHYVLYSSGHTVQMVSEENTAWHVGARNYPANNPRSVGLEHHGWGRPQDWNDKMLEASAKVTAGICHRHSIPIDRDHILGHNEFPGATHTDPGRYFPWSRYMTLVRRYAGEEGRGSPSKPRKSLKMRGINFAAPKGADPDSDELAWHAANAVREGYGRPHMATPEADWGAANSAAEIRFAVDRALQEGNRAEDIQVILVGRKAIDVLDDDQKEIVENDDDRSSGRILYAANAKQLAWRINNAMEQAGNSTEAQRKKAVEHFRTAVGISDDNDDDKYHRLRFNEFGYPNRDEEVVVCTGDDYTPTGLYVPERLIEEYGLQKRYPKASSPAPQRRVRGVYDYTGLPRYDASAVKALARRHNAHPRADEFIDAIYEVCGRVRREYPERIEAIVAPDAASVQMLHETGFCHYTGASRPWNPAGLKKRGASGDSPSDFEVPPNSINGAKMLLNHASAYTHGPTLGEPHGRYYLARDIRADKPPVRHMRDLAGSWAADQQYFEKIKKYLDELDKGV